MAHYDGLLDGRRREGREDIQGSPLNSDTCNINKIKTSQRITMPF